LSRVPSDVLIRLALGAALPVPAPLVAVVIEPADGEAPDGDTAEEPPEEEVLLEPEPEDACELG
jgi:hypothetical protein